MKFCCALFFLYFISMLSSAQENKFIRPNDALAWVNSKGALFTTPQFENPGFLSPCRYGEKNHPYQIYSCNYVMTGINEYDELIARNVIPDDLLGSGPLDFNGRPIDDFHDHYNRVWTVRGEEILAVLVDYYDNDVIDYEIPQSILSWPGRGNRHFPDLFGFELPDQDLAPFLDLNGNDIYEPLRGEIPLLDELGHFPIPHEMSFAVYNDHREHAAEAFEYHQMLFGFDCEENSPINQTIFSRLRIINKSHAVLSNMDFGLSIDADVGCPTDDFWGSDPELNTVYFYNKDEVDGINGSDCVLGSTIANTYGAHPPTVACTYLNYDMKTSLSSSTNSSPISSSDLRLQLDLKGIKVSEVNGEIVYDTVGHEFPNYPTDPNGVSMATAQLNGWDNSCISSIFRHETSRPFFGVTIYNAWYSTSDATLTAHEQTDLLKVDIPIIQSFYDSEFTNCTNTLEPVCRTDCIYPGDVNADYTVSHDDFLLANYFSNSSRQGIARPYTSSDWMSTTGDDWSTDFPNGVNHKHGDCYGDGQGNSQDIQVVADNYGLTTKDFIEEPAMEPTVGNEGVSIDFTRKEIEEGRPSIFRRLFFGQMKVDLNLPEDHDITGISFTMYFDTNFIEYSSLGFDDLEPVSYEKYDEFERLYVNDGAQLKKEFAIYFDDKEKIEDGILFYPGSGWTVKNLEVPAGQDRLFIPLPIHNLYGIDVDGNLQELEFIQDSVWIVREFSAIGDVELASAIDVYPNPADDQFSMQSSYEMAEVQIHDQIGRLVQQIEVDDSVLVVPTINWSAGVYAIYVRLSNGRSIHKKVVINR